MDDWITYLEAEPKSEPFLSIAAAWKADKARLAEAEALLRWCDEHWRSHVYEGSPPVHFLSRIDAFLTPDSTTVPPRCFYCKQLLPCKCHTDRENDSHD